MQNFMVENKLMEETSFVDRGIEADLIITDPPYGVDFKNSFYDDSKDSVFSNIDKWLEIMFNTLKDGGHCYIFVPTLEIDKWIISSKEAGFNFKNILTTRQKTNNPSKNNFKIDNQMILFLTKGKGNAFNEIDYQLTSEAWYKDKRNKNPKKYSYQYSSIFSFFSVNINSKKIHPNEKSVSFLELLIELSSKEGDIVYDPFLGSGATAYAATNLNRFILGSEQDKRYFEYIVSNLEENLRSVA